MVKKNGCWEEVDNNVYAYYVTPNDVLKLEYNQTEGILQCVKGEGKYSDKNKCKEIIY